MENKLWRYNKNTKPATPQAKISMYIVTSVLVSIIVFFLIFYFARATYGTVPKSLTNLSLFVIIGAPAAIIIRSYHANAQPTTTLRAYSFYYDENGELWMFDYNSKAFQQYYEENAPKTKQSAYEKRFGGSLQERTVEYCIKNDVVADVINKPPFDTFAHHIIKVNAIGAQGKYLKFQFTCHSKVNNVEYQGGIAVPLDMDDVEGLRSVFESKLASGGIAAPKNHDEPGVMQIDSVFEGTDDGVILYGNMLEGTIARGDRVVYADEFHEPIFECKVAHIYKDGREIVWATPEEDDSELGYEFHIKNQNTTDFTVENFLLSK